MNLGKSQLINLAMIVALGAIAIVGHQLSPLLLPKADVTGTAEPGCDLQQKACAAILPQGVRLELSITPRPIPFLQALRVEVAVSGVDARKVEVDFAGESMNMGFNRVVLAATGRGSHAGEASLPVCVSGGMTWVATVMVETDRQRFAVPFRFDTGH
ncbi:MAG: hypothetical protein OEL20_04115 [Sulfuritalea sp.]|nr:hypothetical protein [Sulfuritalea sp.]